LPVISENCPACFASPQERARVKSLISTQESIMPDMVNSIKSAIMPLIRNNFKDIIKDNGKDDDE